MSRRRRGQSPLRFIYRFLVTWLILSAFFPLYQLWGLLAVGGISGAVAYFIGKAAGKKNAASATHLGSLEQSGVRLDRISVGLI